MTQNVLTGGRTRPERTDTVFEWTGVIGAVAGAIAGAALGGGGGSAWSTTAAQTGMFGALAGGLAAVAGMALATNALRHR